MQKMPFIKRLYPVALILVAFIVWKFRQHNAQTEDTAMSLVEFKGYTMGSIMYHVKYYDNDLRDFSLEIDSLLKVWNRSLSTYIPDSEISMFNNDSCLNFKSPYFYPVLSASQDVHAKTKGAFDPTVGPLVNAWGFGNEQRTDPDSAAVDSLKNLVGFEKILFDTKKVCKTRPGIKLNFSAIAKGYAVDVVADYLKEKGIKNLMVEIGGEAVCYGKKPENSVWKIGIEDPLVERDDQQILAIAELSDIAMATSGNYRNFYIKDGKRYVHTIDPVSGYPVIHSLLSATVFSETCMKADAYATAFMVMGVDKVKEFLENNKEIDAYLIFQDENGGISTFVTPRIERFIKVPDVKK